MANCSITQNNATIVYQNGSFTQTSSKIFRNRT